MGYDVLSSAESWLEITSLNILDNRGKYPQYSFLVFQSRICMKTVKILRF